MARSDRIYLRIDPSLKEAMQHHCEKKHTTMTELVTRFFVRLLEEEQKEKTIDAEQI